MNTDVFGADAKVYRPERWLDGSREQRSRMESYWIPVHPPHMLLEALNLTNI